MNHLDRSPEHPVAVIELSNVLFVVVIGLSNRDQGVFPVGHVLLPDPVVAGHIPRIDSRIVGRLYPARSPRAPFQQAITIGAAVQLTPVRPLGGVAVPDPRVTQPQELVRDPELEAVSSALSGVLR